MEVLGFAVITEPKEIMAVFRRMDKNGDGHLDVDEMHEAGPGISMIHI